MRYKEGKLIFTPRDFPLNIEVEDRRNNQPINYSMVYTGKRKLKLEKPNIKYPTPQK